MVSEVMSCFNSLFTQIAHISNSPAPNSCAVNSSPRAVATLQHPTRGIQQQTAFSSANSKLMSLEPKEGRCECDPKYMEQNCFCNSLNMQQTKKCQIAIIIVLQSFQATSVIRPQST